MKKYDFIELDFLRKKLKDANIILCSENMPVQINKVNRIGATDYKIHKTTIKEAKTMLNKYIEKLSFMDCMQNLNYYDENGNVFDTLVYCGFRGGYVFYIGWKTDRSHKIENTAEQWNDIMNTYF